MTRINAVPIGVLWDDFAHWVDGPLPMTRPFFYFPNVV